ncbi:hypothetical protein [Rhizobium sp. P44RR-XXIV]|uniref:hypothetical protein n=1 Tax=Rhizobium sp. P44RR-XXIV TaxID=1921145 RepID=UPI00145C1993|nr:hypothetical protein [Rhizobium sp. P44RR-XXIV]
MTKHRKLFISPIREKTDTVFREITSGNVAARLEKSGLLKALRIERGRPIRPQTKR